MKIKRYSYYRNKDGLKKIKLPSAVDREKERIEAATCWRWLTPMLLGSISLLVWVVLVLLQSSMIWLRVFLFFVSISFFMYSNEQYVIWKKIFFK